MALDVIVPRACITMECKGQLWVIPSPTRDTTTRVPELDNQTALKDVDTKKQPQNEGSSAVLR